MTREEAIKAIQDFIGWFKEDSLIRKALDMAIQALSQEPCADAVSRADVIELIERGVGNKSVTIDGFTFGKSLMLYHVKQLPSVTQQTGEWIVYNYPAHECVYCSNCKTEYYEEDLYLGGSEFPKYCPNCGARMESDGE